MGNFMYVGLLAQNQNRQEPHNFHCHQQYRDAGQMALAAAQVVAFAPAAAGTVACTAFDTADVEIGVVAV